jgi:hypothetical protein
MATEILPHLLMVQFNRAQVYTGGELSCLCVRNHDVSYSERCVARIVTIVQRVASNEKAFSSWIIGST